MLIDTLTQQHNELLRLIRQLDVHLARGEVAGVRATLTSLCQELQDHLALEDQVFYPGLLRTEGPNEGGQLLETVKLFSSTMHRIAGALQDFLVRHEDSFHLEQFRACWSTLSAVLVRRIQAEEQTLYSLYKRYLLARLPPLVRARAPFAGTVIDLSGKTLEAGTRSSPKNPP